MNRARADGDLRSIFKNHLPHMHWTPIETASTGGGVPDTNCCWKKIDFWIEYKFTSGNAVKFRPLQPGWIMRRTRAGGRVFIAVRKTTMAGPRREAGDALWLFPGSEVRALVDTGLAGARPCGVWEGSPASWPWEAVERALLA
jgi:hypothetical protein